MNLYVATTPLALLNLREARHQLQPPGHSATLVIVSSAPHYPRSIAQMQALAEGDSGWRETITIRPGNLGHGAYLVRRSLAFRRLARRFSTVDRLVLGHYWAPLFELANRLTYGELFVADEGSSTLDLFDAALGHAGRICAGGMPKTRLRRLGRRVLQVDTAQPSAMSFFSGFCLPDTEQVGYVANDYELLRRRSADCQTKGVWFLGKPWIEKGLMSIEAYSRLLRAAAERAGEPVDYIPHRGEELATRRQLLAELGWNLRDLGVPLEEHVASSGEAPRMVVGCASTALATLAKMLGDRIQYLVIKDNPDAARLDRLTRYLEEHLPSSANFVTLLSSELAA